MRTVLAPIAVLALPLAACASYGYGDPYGSSYGYNPIIGSIGALGGAYGSSFSQAAVNACGSVASRYGRVSIRDVRQTSSNRMKVYGSVMRGFRSENWDCTFRSDGRISDFDI